jgi:hypothetical protein
MPAPPAPAPATASSAESALLLSAVRALRRDRDLDRAGILAADYLRLYPQGALAEEALALGIEAAAARGDREAARLGAEYLRRFPGGRFREVAERALRRPPVRAPEHPEDNDD